MLHLHLFGQLLCGALLLVQLPLVLHLTATGVRAADGTAGAVKTNIAQTPPPPAPFVAPAPARGKWKITIVEEARKPEAPAAGPGASVNPDSPAASPARTFPLSIDITRVDEIRRAVVTLADGAQSTFDFRRGQMITRAGGVWRVIPIRPDAPAYPFAAEDFPLTDWLAAAHFRGTVDYKGAKCFHYDDGQGRQAWIDAATLLPVAARQGNCELVYEFQAPPKGPLPISPEEAAVIYQIDHPPQPAP